MKSTPFRTGRGKIDGRQALHESPETKNEAEIRNLVAWILSR